MTREEAIEFGKRIFSLGLFDELREFCKIAVKALERDSCVDCISRQDVLDLAERGKLVSNGNYKSVCDAINELPSVEPERKHEPCEDVISRREAIKKFTYNYKGERIPDYDCDNFPTQIDIKTVKEILKELPSVEPERKKGKWIKHDTGHSIYYDCSLCGCLAPCTETADEIIWKMANYCPDCGAKMICPQESEGNG